MPTFSIIIPAYNAANTLAEALVSVKNQLFTDWEVILVNDGSTDNTAEVFTEIANGDGRFKIISQANKGLGAARNAAITHATSTWLVFLDADDRWAAAKLLTIFNFIEKNNTASWVYHPVFELYQNGRMRLRTFVEVQSKDDLIYNQNPFVPSAVAIRADIIGAAGGFVEDRNQVEDLGLWLNLLNMGVQPLAIRQALTVYRVGQGVTAAIDNHLQKVFASAQAAVAKGYITNQDFVFFEKRKYDEAARQCHKLGMFAQALEYYNRNKTPSVKMQILRALCSVKISI